MVALREFPIGELSTILAGLGDHTGGPQRARASTPRLPGENGGAAHSEPQ
jgi:hypothetical protein